jgi:hypothetical protein
VLKVLGKSVLFLGLWLFGCGVAQSCEVGEVELFLCPTKAAPRGIILCGQVGEGDQTWRGIRFMQATGKGEILEFPNSADPGPAQLSFSHRVVAKRYEMNERFTIGKDAYTLYYRDAQLDSEGKTKDLPEARVEIRNPKGGLLKTVQCTAKPVAYFREMREASLCDETPLLAGANCFGKAPDVFVKEKPADKKKRHRRRKR